MKSRIFTDKNIKPLEKLVDESKEWIYEGSICKNQFHGPGVQLLKDGIQYEGIWIEGKMKGAGKMINKDDKGTIIQIMECVDGHPCKCIMV